MGSKTFSMAAIARGTLFAMFVGALPYNVAAQTAPGDSLVANLRFICSDSATVATLSLAFITDVCAQIPVGGGASSGASSSAASGGSSGGLVSSGGGYGSSRDTIEAARDRRGDEDGGGSGMALPIDGLSLIIGGGVDSSDRRSTVLENGYDSNARSFLLGLDYQPNASMGFGIAGSLLSSNTEFEAGGGNVHTNVRGLNAYGYWVPGYSVGLSAYVGVANQDSSSLRNIDVTIGTNTIASGQGAADIDGNTKVAGFAAERYFGSGSWSGSVFGQFDWARSKVDGYTEQGTTNLELIYPNQRTTSAIASLGVTAGYSLSLGPGTLTPNIELAYLAEFANKQRRISASFAATPQSSFDVFTDDPDRAWGRFGIGATYEFGRNHSAFVKYEKQFGHSFLDNDAISFGVLIGL